jgi:hypothetical protein
MAGLCETLRREGPTGVEELGRDSLSLEERAAGAATFAPDVRAGVSSGTVAVVYLFDEHTRTEVVREWLDANELDPGAVTLQAQGKGWTRALREVRDGSRMTRAGRDADGA